MGHGDPDPAKALDVSRRQNGRVVTRADDKEALVPVSARKEAKRLVGTLPPRGMEFYKATYGADAVEMLNKAKESGRRDDLGPGDDVLLPHRRRHRRPRTCWPRACWIAAITFPPACATSAS